LTTALIALPVVLLVDFAPTDPTAIHRPISSVMTTLVALHGAASMIQIKLIDYMRIPTGKPSGAVNDEQSQVHERKSFLTPDPHTNA
jgi:hypothetical protein